MIVCGFAGIGKTTLCKQQSNYIDLESTPFEKDWDRYVKVAMHMSNQGYVVMVSCHHDLRQRLHEKGVKYLLVLPEKKLKKEYIIRYKHRGNTSEFISAMKANWDKFTDPLEWETDNLILLDENEVIGNYQDLIDESNRLHG